MNVYEQWITSMNNITTNAVNTINEMDLPDNPTIVFDIDDTLIDKQGNCIEPVMMLYNYAKKKGLTIVIITARVATVTNINKTKYQLTSCGIYDYKAMYFRPINKDDLWKYKLLSRKDLLNKGLNVIMSVGDMIWDIGMYGGVGILLPTF
jgi:predicted secreted acid phosphatase